MTRPKPPGTIDPTCLYPDEQEIGRLILGVERAKYWRGLAIVLERDGFPRIDPEFGGRYWPAVRAFLDERHHVADHRGDRHASR